MSDIPLETDVAIIGAGPTALFTAFECSMLRLRCLLIDALDEVGGQCAALYPEKPIYDIPAHPTITGGALVEALEAQIAPFNVRRLLGHQVTDLKGMRGDFKLATDKGTEITAKAVVIAAGAGAFGPNRPPLEDLQHFEASGAVRYYVRKKAAYAGKTVVIAGGGDSALDWVVELADICRKIYLVHRRDRFRGAPETLARVEACIATGRVEKVVPYQLHALQGTNGQLTGVTVIDMEGATRTLEATHLLPFYGLSTELGPILGWNLSVSRNTLPVMPATMETSNPGIFAVGDVATYPGKLKLILQGFSEGAMAAHAIYPIVHPETALHFEYSTTKGPPKSA